MDHDTLRVLDSLGPALEAARCVAPADRDSVATAGALLETVLSELPRGTPKLGCLLSLGLEALEDIYLGQAPDAEGCLAVLTGALQAALS